MFSIDFGFVFIIIFRRADQLDVFFQVAGRIAQIDHAQRHLPRLQVKQRRLVSNLTQVTGQIGRQSANFESRAPNIGRHFRQILKKFCLILEEFKMKKQQNLPLGWTVYWPAPLGPACFFRRICAGVAEWRRNFRPSLNRNLLLADEFSG